MNLLPDIHLPVGTCVSPCMRRTIRWGAVSPKMEPHLGYTLLTAGQQTDMDMYREAWCRLVANLSPGLPNANSNNRCFEKRRYSTYATSLAIRKSLCRMNLFPNIQQRIRSRVSQYRGLPTRWTAVVPKTKPHLGYILPTAG